VSRSDLADKLSQREGDVSGRLITDLLRQSGVTREVRECGRLDATRRSRAYPGVLQRRFNVLELVLFEEALGMTSKQPSEHLLTRMPHPQSDLANCGFEGFVVAQTAASERLFDRVMEQVALKLSHSARAVAPHSHRAQHFRLTHARSEEHWKRFEYLKVFFPNEFVSLGTWQTECYVEHLQCSQGDSHVRAEFGERSV
jgi:hypothetical protein